MDQQATSGIDQSAIDSFVQENEEGNGQLADLVEQKYDELVEKEAEDKKEEEGEKEDESTESSEESKEKEEGGEDATEASEEPDEEEGYYADEGIDEDDNVETPPVQNQNLDPNQNNDFAKFILASLPAINVVGEQNGKIVNLQVKRANDLPRDFLFTSEYDRQLFQQEIADQTLRARMLESEWTNRQNNQQATDFSKAEDRDIQIDIGDLQREGELRKFKYPPNDRRFNSDPAVIEMQEVLDFYNKENQRRLNESNQNGRLFSRLSYKDAYTLWRKENPKDSPQQKKEDNARKQASRKISNTGQGSSVERKYKLPKDASLDMILDTYFPE